jgi:hypothetical protein
MNAKLRKLLTLAIACSASLAITGCATRDIERKTQDRVERATAVVDAVQASAAAKIEDVPVYQRVQGLWISDRSIRRSPGEALPPIFNRPYAFKSVLPISIGVFAQTVQQACSCNVNLVGESQQLVPMVMEYQGTLRGYVQTQAQRFGVAYAWTENGLEIVQTEARTFPIQRVAYESQAGKKDPWAELEASLRAVAPRARVVTNRATNSITVVDRPSAMREVERFIAHDMDASSRTVLVRWQLINYQSNLVGEAAAAVNVIVNRGGRQLGIVAGQSPADGVGTVRLVNADPLSPTAGSSVVLSLLNQYGKATILRDGLMPIHNNDSRTYAETLKVPFPSKVTLASIPGLGTNTANVTQIVPVTELSAEEVGLEIKMAATIHPSEEVDLSVDYRLRQITAMRDFSTQNVRQEAPETARRQTDGRFRTRHGESFLLVMDNKDSSLYDQRVGFAAGDSGETRQDQWLVLITPIISKGNL